MRVSPAAGRFDHLADFRDHRVIHLAVEQHLAGLASRPLAQAATSTRADDAHHRVEPDQP